MKNIRSFGIGLGMVAWLAGCSVPVSEPAGQTVYDNNREPLQQKPYLELPLGTIKADGWLKEMLVRQKDGATGQLDKLYPHVMGKSNGWLGGDGDQWERAPYWIDGLLPLAYILDDSVLIAKTKPWIEWALYSQKENGYFGPDKELENNVQGLQRDNCGDWWPKMVVLKILQQHYSATGDERVIRLMSNYFDYQLKMLPEQPLDHWTFWAKYRGGDNLMSVYWLYNITGDKSLLQLADVIYRQTFPFDTTFEQENWWRTGSMHCVNLVQGMKAPVIYYQQHQDSMYLKSVKKGLDDMNRYLSGPHGVILGDEALHGNNPTQGSELCTVVEFMFSLEQMLQITGDTDYAAQLERVAFNALPAQTSDDYMNRQYFQQLNQVEVSRKDRNFDTNHWGTDLCFGLLTGYPCCTSNMHQGWPKFTQNLYYATPDGGIAVMLYAPSSVRAKINGGHEVTIKEQTDYPFDEKIRFEIGLSEPVTFPFELRLPDWCEAPVLRINGVVADLKPNSESVTVTNEMARVERLWKDGDVVELELPMRVKLSEWYERSRTVERGPLIYALKLDEQWRWSNDSPSKADFGEGFWEVYTTSPWNYGLIETPEDQLQNTYVVERADSVAAFPWSVNHAPLAIRTEARRIPNWTLYNGSAGPLPYSIAWGAPSAKDTETITLIPYGCTTLRITEFPVLGNYTIK